MRHRRMEGIPLASLDADDIQAEEIEKAIRLYKAILWALAFSILLWIVIAAVLFAAL
ncbi:hypothetical protein [Sphingosinicella sp. BN140058]|uniref:hypothetical protein n=1 Tax=Sphingosinicella sp. BN140058 TaxID=1892855 RepID=UPI0013EB1004|nr:hypothetical protein [Sphingosinicella sp. BN140058]